MDETKRPKFIAILYDNSEISEVIDTIHGWNKTILHFNDDNGTVSTKHQRKWFSGFAFVIGDDKDDVKKKLSEAEERLKVFLTKFPEPALIGKLDSPKEKQGPKLIIVSYPNGDISEIIRVSWAIKKDLLRFNPNGSVQTKHKERWYFASVIAFGETKSEVKKMMNDSTSIVGKPKCPKQKSVPEVEPKQNEHGYATTPKTDEKEDITRYENSGTDRIAIKTEKDSEAEVQKLLSNQKENSKVLNDGKKRSSAVVESKVLDSETGGLNKGVTSKMTSKDKANNDDTEENDFFLDKAVGSEKRVFAKDDKQDVSGTEILDRISIVKIENVVPSSENVEETGANVIGHVENESNANEGGAKAVTTNSEEIEENDFDKVFKSARFEHPGIEIPASQRKFVAPPTEGAVRKLTFPDEPDCLDKSIEATDNASTVPMTFNEKRQLNYSINKLSSNELKKVLDIIKQLEPSHQDSNSEEVDVDFEELQTSTLRALENFVAASQGYVTPKKNVSPKATSLKNISDEVVFENDVFAKEINENDSIEHEDNCMDESSSNEINKNDNPAMEVHATEDSIMDESEKSPTAAALVTEAESTEDDYDTSILNIGAVKYQTERTPLTHRVFQTPTGNEARRVLIPDDFNSSERRGSSQFSLDDSSKENIDPEERVNIQLEKWIGLQFNNGDFSPPIENEELAITLIDCITNQNGDIYLTLSDNRFGQVIAQSGYKEDCQKKIDVYGENFEQQVALRDRLSYLEDEQLLKNAPNLESTRVENRMPFTELPISPVSSPLHDMSQAEREFVMENSSDAIFDTSVDMFADSTGSAVKESDFTAEERTDVLKSLSETDVTNNLKIGQLALVTPPPKKTSQDTSTSEISGEISWNKKTNLFSVHARRKNHPDVTESFESDSKTALTSADHDEE